MHVSSLLLRQTFIETIVVIFVICIFVQKNLSASYTSVLTSSLLVLRLNYKEHNKNILNDYKDFFWLLLLFILLGFKTVSTSSFEKNYVTVCLKYT